MQAARPEQKSTYDNIYYHLLPENTTGRVSGRHGAAIGLNAMHPVGDGAADDVALYVLAGLGTERLRWRLIGCAFLAFDRRCTQWQGNLLEQWRQASAGIESMAELGGTSALKSEINASPSALAVVEQSIASGGTATATVEVSLFSTPRKNVILHYCPVKSRIESAG